MRKTVLKLVLALTTVLAFVLIPSVKSEAAVKTMPDGGLFDPSFYAATYPDVYAAFGMNETLLYQHYKLCGIKENRLPYEGYVKASEIKLTFSTVGAIVNANSREDVISALRLAAQFRVTKLTILTTWNGTLSAESIKTVINGQGTFVKTFYGATMTTTEPIVYGSVQNPTIETNVTLRFR